MGIEIADVCDSRICLSGLSLAAPVSEERPVVPTKFAILRSSRALVTSGDLRLTGDPMKNPRAAIATTIIAFIAALALPMLDVLAYKAAAETVTTLRLFSHDTQQTSLDLGPSGPGPGDQLIFSGDVFTEPGGMRLGRLAGQVTTLSGDLTAGEVLLANSFVLDGGQIAIQVLADSAALLGRGETLPVLILGGTGIYAGARGDGTIQVPNQTDANFVLNVVSPY